MLKLKPVLLPPLLFEEELPNAKFGCEPNVGATTFVAALWLLNADDVVVVAAMLNGVLPLLPPKEVAELLFTVATLPNGVEAVFELGLAVPNPP